MIAHELGHGLWKLKHTFDDSYGKTAAATEGTTDNLMDYNKGAHLAKWQWDVMREPAIFDGVFDSDEEGMMKDNVPYSGLKWVQFTPGLPLNTPKTFLAPSGRPFSVTGNLTDCWVASKLEIEAPYSDTKLIITHPGAVYGFKIGDQSWEAIFSDKKFLGYYNRKTKDYYRDNYTLTIDKNTLFKTYYWLGERWTSRYSAMRLTEGWVNLERDNPDGYLAAGNFEPNPVSRLKSSANAPKNAEWVKNLKWKDYEYSSAFIQAHIQDGLYTKYFFNDRKDSIYVYVEINNKQKKYYLFDPNMVDWQEYQMPGFEDDLWINGLAVIINEGHSLLDALGMIPAFGEAFDAINGVWYLVEGEFGYAVLSGVSVIPVIGTSMVAVKSLVVM